MRANTVLLWRLFWVLAVLQAADLLTTYQVLASGGHEGNVFMRATILTPAAPMLKTLALVFFASLILMSARWGRPAPRRLMYAAYGLIAVYAVIVANNLAQAVMGR